MNYPLIADLSYCNKLTGVAAPEGVLLVESFLFLDLNYFELRSISIVFFTSDTLLVSVNE